LKSDHKEQETIRLYLLGETTPEASSWLEEQLLADGDLFQELLIAEDELVDRYVRDELTPNERQGFETHFLLAPERQRKLRFGQTLQKYVNLAGTSETLAEDAAENVSDEKPDVAKPPPKRGIFSLLPFSNPIVSYSLAAAMLLIAVGVSWVVFNNWRQRTPQRPGNVYVVTLTPGQTRDDSSGLKRVIVQGPTDGVQLQLMVPTGENQKYKVELQTSEGRNIFTQENLEAEVRDGSRQVVITVPARLLAVGDYQVSLGGLDRLGQTEPLGKYFFRVVRP
jgi:hypothetical protein